MNRRGFLGALAGAIAGASLDPEQLLWVPGKRLISIPRPLVIPTDAGPIYISLGCIPPGSITVARISAASISTCAGRRGSAR